jgi:hypothetical protein
VFSQAAIDCYTQDSNLAVILRDYLAQGRQLPGVRTGLESLPWPSANSTRPAPASTVNNGGDYVASRRALLSQYVARWLLALHDQDVRVYANVLYDICTDLAEDVSVDDKLFLGEREVSAEQVSPSNSSMTICAKIYFSQKRKTTYADSILRCIIKLCQATVTFSVFDDLFLMWLETVSAMNLYHKVLATHIRRTHKFTIWPSSSPCRPCIVYLIVKLRVEIDLVL